MNTFYTGDVLEILSSLPSESVHCCVTSPPYFGLRDYGVSGQIGLEQTPEEYVNKLVNAFREVKRVLRKDGTLWLNLGDSFASVHTGGHKSEKSTVGSNRPEAQEFKQNKARPQTYGLKEKDLIGIPWMVAFALQADGWYLRSDIIWEKPNAMPESVRDRPTRSHEYIFLLSKSKQYYYDQDAIREPSVCKSARGGSLYNDTGREEAIGMGRKRWTGERSAKPYEIGRNRRTVWSIATKPFKGAHFAVFPPDLIKPCILAGCPIGGKVLDPFGGSGTVAMVASELGRDSIYIDLNTEYTEMAKDRASTLF